MMKDILQSKFPKISSFEKNKKIINICCVAYDDKAEKVYDGILSVLKSKNIDESINFWIIQDKIRQQNMDYIKSLENNYDCSVNFIKLKLTDIADEALRQEDHIKACCNVLFSDAIKSDRIIYIDNNVDVNQSLWGLYNSDFEDNYILSSVNITSKDNVPSVGIVNCGVMLINLKKLRSLNFKYNNDISDVITTDKIKYIKNDIKLTTDRNRFTSPFGMFYHTGLKGFMKNILSFKANKKESKKIFK